MEFGTRENLARNLLFIDGLPRTGKSGFSGVVPSLQFMEHLQFFNLIEHIVPAVGLGRMDAGLARSILRTQLNELAYNIKLSRCVNFRKEDQTGIANYKWPSIYYARLDKQEGDGVVQELRAADWYIPIQSHDLMVNLDVLNDMDLDYKMLEIYRNPIDTVESWWAKGWGERFLDDPRVFTLSLRCGDVLVPWYCAEHEEEWLALNPVERCVMSVVDLFDRTIKQYRAAPDKGNILWVDFTDFAQYPHDVTTGICKFLETTTSEDTIKQMLISGVPREIGPEVRQEKERRIKQEVSSDMYMKLLESVEQYHQFKEGC